VYFLGARAGNSGLRCRYGFFGAKRGIAKKNCPCVSLAQQSVNERAVSATLPDTPPASAPEVTERRTVSSNGMLRDSFAEQHASGTTADTSKSSEKIAFITGTVTQFLLRKNLC